MEKKTEIKTSYNLTEEDLKQAVIEYMYKHYSEDFCLEEIHLESEMSDPDTFGETTCKCERIDIDK